MLAKKPLGSPEIDADEAPELTTEMLVDAEVFNGDAFVRRGRGRPPLASPKEKINVRMDAPVLQQLRTAGPGWQTRVNEGMAMWTGVDRKLWDWVELMISSNEEQLKNLRQETEMMETGVMHSFTNGHDTTLKSLERNKDGVEQLQQAIAIMRKTQEELQGRYLRSAHTNAKPALTDLL